MSDLPTVGSMLIAHRRMRAWINDYERGDDGLYVKNGDMGLVLETWKSGPGRVRIRLLINDNVVMFSHVENCVWLIWSTVTNDTHL